MNLINPTSNWLSRARQLSWGLLGCVLFFLAFQSAFDSAQDSSLDAAVSPYPHYIPKKIEEIQVGDHVLAWDEDSGEYASKPVVEVYQRVTDHLRILQLQSRKSGELQTIKTTDEHPFWVDGTGWVNAGDLQPQDQLSDPDGNAIMVVSTRYEPHAEGIEVFNFQVEDFHDYFVRSGDIRGPPVLVHNASVGYSKAYADNFDNIFGSKKRITSDPGRAKPEPNAIYEINGYKFETDELGQVVRVTGTAKLKKAGRDMSLQRAIGNEGVSSDVGFHLMADIFDGPSNRLNIIAFNGKPVRGMKNINGSAYKTGFEHPIQKAGSSVEVDIAIRWDSSGRATSITAQYRVGTGDWYGQSYLNVQ